MTDPANCEVEGCGKKRAKNQLRCADHRAAPSNWNETIQSDAFKALSQPAAKVKPVAPGWRVQFSSRVVMPKPIPDVVMEPGIHEAMLSDCGRIHELTIEGDNNVIDMSLEVNKHGSQVGDFNIVIQTESGMNIPSEVRMVMGLFLCLDFAGIAHLVKVEAVDGAK